MSLKTKLAKLAFESLQEGGDWGPEGSGYRYKFLRTDMLNIYSGEPWFNGEYKSIKLLYSLVIDGEQLPFATVKKTNKIFLPSKFETKIEILPCMIPKALEALALYIQSEPIIKFDYDHRLRFLQEVEEIQKGLIDLQSSVLLKKEELSQKLKVA